MKLSSSSVLLPRQRDFLLMQPASNPLRSRANISGTTYRISTEFKLPFPDVGRYARSVSFIVGDVERGKIFLVYPGLEKTPARRYM